MVNSIRTFELQRPLAAMHPADEQAWRKWLTMYQLNPDRMPLGSDIEADDQNRTITATYFRGQTQPDGSFAAFYDRDRHEFETEQVIRRLESKPAPFPSDGTSQS